MPITLYDADGNPQEVPSAEEIEAIKKSQEESETKFKELSQTKEELEKEKAELEGQVNPNWKAFREKEKKMKEALKESGKEVDDEGNIITKKDINEDEILEKAGKIYDEKSYNTEKERLLASYSEDDKKTISIFIDKLMSGEEKNISNLHKFTEQAVGFVFPNSGDKIKKSAFSSNGSEPNIKNSGKPTEGAVKMGEGFGISEDDLNDSSPVIKL